MSRYIDAEQWEQELADAAKTLYTEGDFESGDYAYLLLNRLQERPTADVSPVIHAHWEKHTGYVRCSNCHTCFTTEFNYCGECGANMDMEE